MANRINFNHEAYAQRLWATMLTHYRRVLAICLNVFALITRTYPFLPTRIFPPRRYTDDPKTPAEFSTTILAAV